MEYLLKASVVIAVFHLCFYLFLKKETFFNHNRWFLLMGLMIALILPFIVIPIYVPVEPIIMHETTYVQDLAPNVAPSQPTSTFNWSQILPFIYGTGFVVFLIQFLFQFGSLALLLIKHPKYSDKRFTYVTVNTKISPFSFFKWIVYNPESFNQTELDLILTHEKVHAKQLHSIDILIAQIACVIFWFNPLVWLYRNGLRQNLEYIADYNTQSNTVNDKEYQHLLLKTSVANHDISLSNNFYNSSIKKRILMLNKSRSHRKNLWKYLLMIPLFAGLLLSMNTEEIYFETSDLNPISNSEKNISAIITKHTSDAELQSILQEFKQNNIALSFENLERNSNNQITNITVKLYDSTYGGHTSNNAIESFLIYTELFNNKGAFIGRIGGASIKFVALKEEANKTVIDNFLKRAHNVIIQSGMQSEDDLKFQKESISNTFMQSESIKVTFTKNMSDASLEEKKQWLKSKNVTMTINRLKRNSKNEISDISISFKSKNNTANYNVNDDDGITPFEFKMDDNSFGVSTVQNEKPINKTFKVWKIKDQDSVYVETIRDEKNVFLDTQNDTLYFKMVDSSEVKQLSKEKTDYYYEGGKTIKIITSGEEIVVHQPQMAYKNISTYADKKPKPLLIIEDTEVNYESIDDINPNEIKSLTVLKGDKAISKYGKKGKNGVLEITLHDEKSKTKKSDGPWKIERTELTSVTYIDDEDSSKNGTIVYISKFTTDKILEDHKTQLKKSGINVKYSKLRRNKANEITSIKISLNNENGKKSSASFKNDDGISNIEYGISEGGLIVRTSTYKM